MKHYFLTAKHVGDLTAILCAGLEERQAKPAPVLSRMMARLRPARSRRTLSETDDFPSTIIASTSPAPTSSGAIRSI